MTTLASLWRRAMVYLGLQDDENEYGYDPYGEQYADRGDDYRYGGGPGGHPDPDPRVPEYADVGGGRTEALRPVREAPPSVQPHAGYGEPTVRALPRDEAPSGVSVPRPPVVRSVPTSAAKVHVVEPLNFNDAQEIGDRVKGNQAVILNLQGSPRELQRRLIDFSSGLAYAVGGSMSRVADSVFLLTPMNVQLSEEEKERLEARGLYRR
ncbi:MAG TPA: cell division protein SepF [Acidimicrobiia bacterium]|nr:cell division protein SepF [Acidimicrobiia bacterium]